MSLHGIWGVVGVVTLQDPLCTIIGLNVSGEMSAVAFHLPSAFFYEMEALGVLDPDDECDLFVLHCIFLPRINRSLTSFTQAWNSQLKKNWTPRQIMINNMIKESEINQNETPIRLWC